jgi:replicative DNA helicase
MTDTTPSFSDLPSPPDLGYPADPGLISAADLIATLITGVGDGHPAAVPTGVRSIDDPHGGLFRGSLTLVCAAPSVDRTTPLLAVALHAADQEHPVALYLPGVTPAMVAAKLATAAAVAELDRSVDPDSEKSISDAVALTRTQHWLATLPMRFMVGQTLSCHDLRAASLSADDPPSLIVIDNFTLLTDGGSPSDLKNLAMDLNAALLCSTTVPAGRDGVDSFHPDTELLNAADTIAWVNSTGVPLMSLVIQQRT